MNCRADNNRQFTIGINEVGLLPKLKALPQEQVWEELKKAGFTSVELCTAFDGTERARKRGDEIEFAYTGGKGPGMLRGKAVFEKLESAKKAGLRVISIHLMFTDAYPEYIREALPFLSELCKKGIEQFVVSCSFESPAVIEEYIPHFQYAAQQLQKEGAVLCYHNHHKDCMKMENGLTPMEMLLEVPELKFQFDIGWAWYAQMDGPAFIKEHADRIASIHLKDVTADSRERTDIGRFTAIGSGAVNTKECLALLDCCNLAPDRLITDQDASAGNILEDAAASVAFVRKCLGI